MSDYSLQNVEHDLILSEVLFLTPAGSLGVKLRFGHI